MNEKKTPKELGKIDMKKGPPGEEVLLGFYILVNTLEFRFWESALAPFKKIGGSGMGVPQSPS